MAKLNLPLEFLNDYAAYVKTDYAKWSTPKNGEPVDEVRQQMINEFEVTFEVGSTYVKVIEGGKSQRSVHSFIVNKAGKKFPLGTVLKAASWASPATNFARADLLNRETWVGKVTWTGVF